MDTRRSFLGTMLYAGAAIAGTPALELLAETATPKDPVEAAIRRNGREVTIKQGDKNIKGIEWTFAKDGVSYRGFVPNNGSYIDLGFRKGSAYLTTRDYSIDAIVDGGSTNLREEGKDDYFSMMDDRDKKDNAKRGWYQKFYTIFRDIFIEQGRHSS